LPQEKIISRFKNVDFFVPILTSNSISTQYINQEIGYARAKQIIILPIVEKEIIHLLKGFITSQNDLSFTFRTFEGNKKKERKEFRETCELLMGYISSKIKKTNIKLSDIFNGSWQNDYEFPDGRKGSEPFKIKKGNQYYLDGDYMFRLDNIFISKDKKTIRFRKNGVKPNDNRKATNILSLKKNGVYFGDEEGNKVIYSKK
jgi:hypothetical protein